MTDAAVDIKKNNILLDNLFPNINLISILGIIFVTLTHFTTLSILHLYKQMLIVMQSITGSTKIRKLSYEIRKFDVSS